ncbi:RNA-binding protein [Corchorus olitorius]|uniref:RNA-binding protein n=1 Tax=Corchorus olitorius TaxID=93759 RepID=A0A1R3G3P3_9ROSI|nr:RNA-binding protein [Corchorus olitorius]
MDPLKIQQAGDQDMIRQILETIFKIPLMNWKRRHMDVATIGAGFCPGQSFRVIEEGLNLPGHDRLDCCPVTRTL